MSDLVTKVYEGIGAYGLECHLTGNLAPSTELMALLKEMETNHKRYLALRNKSTKDFGVRRRAGYTYVPVTGYQLDQASDVLGGM